MWSQRGRQRRRGGVQLGLGACPLRAGVGGAQHLRGRHPEARLRAAALLQQQGLEGVAAGGGLAEVALDGACLAGQGGGGPRAHPCGGGRWRLGLAPSLELVVL